MSTSLVSLLVSVSVAEVRRIAYLLPLLLAAAYMAPTMLAFARAVPGVGAIAKVNFLWGWTGTGWSRALKMALATPPASGSAPAPADASWRARVYPGCLEVPWRAGVPPLLTSAGGAGAAGPGREGQPGAPAVSAAGIQMPAGQSNGVAVAGMVLGILAVVFEWFGLITLAMALTAVVLGAVGLNRSAATGAGRRQGIAGITLGIIGLAAYLFWGAISAGILWFV